MHIDVGLHTIDFSHPYELIIENKIPLQIGSPNFGGTYSSTSSLATIPDVYVSDRKVSIQWKEDRIVVECFENDKRSNCIQLGAGLAYMPDGPRDGEAVDETIWGYLCISRSNRYCNTTGGTSEHITYFSASTFETQKYSPTCDRNLTAEYNIKDALVKMCKHLKLKQIDIDERILQADGRTILRYLYYPALRQLWRPDLTIPSYEPLYLLERKNLRDLVFHETENNSVALFKAIMSQILLTNRIQTIPHESNLPKMLPNVPKEAIKVGAFTWEHKTLNLGMFHPIRVLLQILPLDTVVQVINEAGRLQLGGFHALQNTEPLVAFLNKLSLAQKIRITKEWFGDKTTLFRDGGAIHELQDAASQYIAYCNMQSIKSASARAAFPNGIVLPKKWKTIKELHDAISLQYRRIQELEAGCFHIPYKMRPEAERRLHHAVVGPFVVRLPRTKGEVVAWGNEMHHCIASYYDKAKDGQSILLGFYKDGKLTYNAEISCVDVVKSRKGGTAYVGKLNQIHGVHNCSCQEDEHKLISTWLKKTGFVVKDRNKLPTSEQRDINDALRYHNREERDERNRARWVAHPDNMYDQQAADIL